jgi:tetrahydromethanopterin S-methyltransferase subunit F
VARGGYFWKLPGKSTGLARGQRTEDRREAMDNATILQIVCGVLFAIVLVVLVQRRRMRTR